MKIEVRTKNEVPVVETGFRAMDLYTAVCRAVEHGHLHPREVEVKLHKANEVVVLDLGRLNG